MARQTPKRRVLTLTLIAPLVCGILSAPALAQTSQLNAEIRAGSCEQPGAVVAKLSPPVVPTSKPQGSPNAVSGAVSFTYAADTISDLLQDRRVITISRADDVLNVLACGAVGGSPDDHGAFGVVIRPQTGGGPAGVAYLQPNGDVALFLDPGNLIENGSPGSIDDAASALPATPIALQSQQVGMRNRPAPIGSTLANNEIAVTITKVHFSRFIGFNTAPEGERFLTIDVRLEGRGPGHSYAYTDFSGENVDNGAIYDSTLITTDNMILHGVLSNGEVATGSVILVVPLRNQGVLIKYDPSRLDSNDFYWIVP